VAVEPIVSPSLSSSPRSEAEQIVLLTKELAWSRLKIQALEERLRLEMIRKYGAKSEKLSEAELQSGTWHTEPRSNRQTCIEEVEFDADAQRGEEPQ